MKLAESPVQVQSNAQFDETFAITIGSSAEAVAMVIERLISAYKNPYRAALREYTSNAYDEHVASGQTKPVEVSLPDTLSPVLKVQDFGRGLTREELKGFGTIGESTKRASNDFTGGFGMGSKSALAAAPQFTVTSVKNGKRNTVVVARDSNNVPQMQFLAEQDSTDETGTTIVVPISDVSKFEDLENFWLGWKPGTVLVDGKEPKNSVYNPDLYATVADGAGYRNRAMATPGRDVIRVLINQVFYEISYKDLNISYQQWNALKFYVLRLENGQVDIAPSRETLLFNARTKAHVEKQVQKLMTIASFEAAKAVEAATNVKDALRKLDEMERLGYPITDVKYNGKRIVLPGMTVNGNRIPSSEGTWAKPIQKQDTKAGWMVEKTWSHIGTKHPHRFGDNTKFVIIHSAAPATSYGTYYNRTAHKESFGVADWLTTITDARRFSWEVFITSDSPNRINALYKGLADVLISAEDFSAVANKVKSDRAREEREAKSGAKVKNTKLRVLRASGYGYGDYIEMDSAEISSKYKSIIILRNQSGGMDEKMRQSLTTKANRTPAWNNTAWALARSADAAMLLVGKNDKMDDFLPLLPPVVTFGSIAASLVKDSFKKISKIDRMALRDRSNLNVAAFSYLTPSAIAQIKRKETREWATALREFKDEGAEIRSTYSWMTSYFPEVKDAYESGKDTAKDGAALPTSPLHRYPLLKGVSYYSVKDSDVVEYVNLMDKTHKKSGA